MNRRAGGALVHERIGVAMLHNAGVFLRKAAEEITGHRLIGVISRSTPIAPPSSRS